MERVTPHSGTTDRRGGTDGRTGEVPEPQRGDSLGRSRDDRRADGPDQPEELGEGVDRCRTSFRTPSTTRKQSSGRWTPAARATSSATRESSSWAAVVPATT